MWQKPREHRRRRGAVGTRRADAGIASTAALLTIVLSAAACGADSGPPDLVAIEYLRITRAEDARPETGSNLGVMLEALTSTSAQGRAAAVRALGRFETPGMTDAILPGLRDPDAAVRSEAANALAQAHHRGSGSAALAPLLERVQAEGDVDTRAMLARSLGRLALEADSERVAVAGALVALSRTPEGGEAPTPQVVGAALGMESFVRRARETPLDEAIAERLRELLTFRGSADADSLQASRVRALAFAALGTAAATTEAEIVEGLKDGDPGVRRSAASRLGGVPARTRPGLQDQALSDASAQVRWEAVRSFSAEAPDEASCSRLLARATGDADTGVRLAALDALARPCPDRGAQITMLTGLASSLPAANSRDWHESAHALAALANLDAESAATLLSRFTAHPNPFVRAYAARASGAVRDVGALRTLIGDTDPNVRTAAFEALSALEERSADPMLIEALGSASDAQLLLTVAGLLEETSLRSEALEAALGTLERLTMTRAQTLRDARVAILGLIEEVGDEGAAPEVARYLADFDPAVSGRAAEILTNWTGEAFTASPLPAVRLGLPTPAELRAMEAAKVVLRMALGGEIEITLLPFVATTNAYRLFHLVRSGALNGLTFHRVAPNFVVQGGSPGANEYAGYGTFTRDEVGLPVQWRGTVGVSTRGRDTGDGQIYVNLVDNARLDHDYTVLGFVSAGMDVVDAILEGDVIELAEVRAETPGGARP